MGMRQILTRTGLALLGSLIAAPALYAADAPPMGGGYTNVVPIPVDDAAKAIAGALVKPQGVGPFPVAVYMPPCGGPNFPLELKQEKLWAERLNAKGIAVFFVDPFVPRGLQQGNCEKLLTVLPDVQNKNEAVLNILKQASDDAVAAVKAVKALPDIDPKKIFLMGFSYGATAVLSATDPSSEPYDTGVRGVVAYFPLCADKPEAAVPTLIHIGEKDDWTGPVAACKALNGRKNYDVTVYPGATHSFDMQFDQPLEFAGHKLAYDPAAAKDAADRTVAFMESHLK